MTGDCCDFCGTPGEPICHTCAWREDIQKYVGDD